MDKDKTWFRLYRKLEKSRVFKSEGLLKVWVWCLIRASYKDRWVSFKTGRGNVELELKPGQFVFGRYSAAKKLQMNPNTIWKRMQKLKNMENLTIESNTQYSIVTILNWDSYQPDAFESNIESNKQVSSKCLASNTNNRKGKKDNKKITTLSLEKSNAILKQVVDLFHKILPELPSVKLKKDGEVLSKIIIDNFYHLLKSDAEYKSMFFYDVLFSDISKMPLLMGEGEGDREWNATFAWIFDTGSKGKIKPFTNLNKILSGKYEKIEKKSTAKIEYVEPEESRPEISEEERQDNIKQAKDLQKKFGLKKV